MDELNQVQETNTEEDLFDDYEETTSEPEETEETETQETETKTVENPFSLNVKYNGEDRSLNEEEARTFAQKGMNYDRIYEPLQRLARMNGLGSVGEYLNMLNDTQVTFEVSKEMENLRNNPRYEGVSDEVLEEIATAKVNENIGNQDRLFEEQQRGEADAEQARVQRDIEIFMNEYPEFRDKGPDALDQRVFDYVKQGYTLLEAYNKYAREEAEKNRPAEEAKEKISKQNEENKKRSLGSTTNAGNVESDDFLSGFFNG